jgi:hypothetical protein
MGLDQCTGDKPTPEVAGPNVCFGSGAAIPPWSPHWLRCANSGHSSRAPKERRSYTEHAMTMVGLIAPGQCGGRVYKEDQKYHANVQSNPFPRARAFPHGKPIKPNQNYD